MAARGASLGRIPASALVIAAVFSVQFGNALGGALFDRVGPLGAAALRLLFAAAILIAIVRPRLGAWTRRHWIGAVALGLAMGGMNACIYLAIDRIPIGIAVTIELLGPLAVAAAGIRRAVDALWVLLALGGIGLLAWGLSGRGGAGAGGLGAAGSGGLLLGVLAALAAAGCWALYILASARLGPSVRGVDGLAVALAVAAVAVLPFGIGQAASGVEREPWLLLAFAGLALLTSVIPYALEFTALKRMPSRVFGVLSSLGPAVAAVAGFAVLGQSLSPVQLAAILLVIVASAGAVAASRRTA